MKRFGLIVWAMACLISLQAETRSISLADARKLAREQNKSLQTASLDIQQAQAQRWQSIAQMLPQATFDMNYINMFNHKMNFGGMEIAMPHYGTLGVTVSAAINGQLVMAAILRNMAIEMQEINAKNSEQQIDGQVLQVYSAIQVMNGITDLLADTKANIDTMYQMAQHSVEVGVGVQTTADQIAVRINTLENSIRSTERSINIYKNSLKLLLGLDPNCDLDLTTSLDQILSAESTLSLLGADFNINDNYNWQLVEKNTELAKQQVTLAKMAYTPTLSVAYQYSARKTFSNEATMNMTMPHTFSLGLSVPLWSSGNKAAAVTEKKLAYEAAKISQSNTKDQLLVQDQQLRFNLNNAYETYETERKNIEVVKRVMQQVANKFKHGVASNQELITASNDLITAENSYAQAALSLIQAQIELQTFLNK